VLSKRRTYALHARTGRVVWSLGRGAFNPAISDGTRLYITGYSSVYSFAAPEQVRRDRAVLRQLQHQAQAKANSKSNSKSTKKH
jgi:hypothetical protein